MTISVLHCETYLDYFFVLIMFEKILFHPNCFNIQLSVLLHDFGYLQGAAVDLLIFKPYDRSKSKLKLSLNMTFGCAYHS